MFRKILQVQKKKKLVPKKKKLGLKSSETFIESISGGCPKSRGGGLSGVEVKIARICENV